jgi:hypothetical protein
MRYLNNEEAVKIIDCAKLPEGYEGPFSIEKFKVHLPDHHFTSSAMFLFDNADEYNCFILPKDETADEFTLVSVKQSNESTLTKAETTLINAFVNNQTAIGYLFGIEGVFNDNLFREVENENIREVENENIDTPVEYKWI